MKNFGRDFNQTKVSTSFIYSPKHKVGAYNCTLGAQVTKHPILKNEFFFGPNLHCESADQSKFPVDVYLKFCVLNQEKDSGKKEEPQSKPKPEPGPPSAKN